MAWATLFWKATQRNSSSCCHPSASTNMRVTHLITRLFPVQGLPWINPRRGCSAFMRLGWVLASRSPSCSKRNSCNTLSATFSSTASCSAVGASFSRCTLSNHRPMCWPYAMVVSAADGNVLPWKGAGRSSCGFFAIVAAFFTYVKDGKVPSSKNRSAMSRATFASSGGLSHRFRPRRMVRACLPIAFNPSSEFRVAIPCRVCRTRSIEPAFTSKFSHCSASESSAEFSESSILVAAVAANRFWMNRKEDMLQMLSLM